MTSHVSPSLHLIKQTLSPQKQLLYYQIYVPLPTTRLIEGKLREALISLRKEDTEAHDILLASIKVGILAKHTESYLPSLITLLTFESYPSIIQTWYALYILFILEDPFEFYTFATKYTLPQYYMDLAKALVNGNYIVYTNLLSPASRFDKSIVLGSPADIKVKKRIVEVVGKCYHQVDVSWFNRLSTTDRWKRDGNMYIIKRLQKSS